MPAAGPQPAEITRTCGRCGTPLVAGARYCHQCGQRIPADEYRGWPVFAAKTLLLIAIADCVIGSILAVWEIETIVVTGPILASLGLGLITLSIRWQMWPVMRIGLAHVIIALGIFLWIFIAEVGPGRAHMPVSVLAWTYSGVMLWPTWRAFRLIHIRHDPSRCQKCGYLLFGLSEPRCPECGTVFNPAAVPAAPHWSALHIHGHQ